MEAKSPAASFSRSEKDRLLMVRGKPISYQVQQHGQEQQQIQQPPHRGLLVPASSSALAFMKRSRGSHGDLEGQARNDSFRRDDASNSGDSSGSLPDDFDQLEDSRQALLDSAVQNFTVAYDSDRGYRATELFFRSCARPHMRAFHASWALFHASYFVQFSHAPLLPEMQVSLHLSRADLWRTNVWMVVGGIPARFLLGPLCDKYGARTIMSTMVALSALPCALTGWVAVDLTTLTVVRTLLGAMDAFVPGQYWITCHFCREVAATAMAISGGLGAAGSAATQLVTGSMVFALLRHGLLKGMLRSISQEEAMNSDSSTTSQQTEVIVQGITEAANDLAWRWSLVFPAIVAIATSLYFYLYSDDCPLGNFSSVKKAGLMMERSAVDSFRSGVYNVNSWILFLQFAASSGVDVTMCNGAALYFHEQFQQSTAAASAMACLYGVSAVYARGMGGWLSDAVYNRWSLRGRLYAHFLVTVLQGLVNVWFARTSTSLLHSLLILVFFSVLVQMSMGTCYGIVPYVHGPSTGSVAGIVGAGGNVGAALLAGLLFMNEKRFSYPAAMQYMGWFTVAVALLTPLIVIKGYRGICFGKEVSTSGEKKDRKQHSPLLVPGKVQNSPHLVPLRH